MRTSIYKYLSPFLLYGGAFVSFFSSGFVVWLPLIYSFVLIPLLELLLRPDERNLSEAEEEFAKKNAWYDRLLYLVVPFQYAALACFLYVAARGQAGWMDVAGRTLAMGLLCGVMGINVGHELGHRAKKGEQLLAKILLLSSLYMHFFIEHNKGHHKKVGTREDPASARYGETLYAFHLRSVLFGYLSAWKIADREARKKGYRVFSLRNEMLRFQLIQLAFVALLYFLFGALPTLLFLLAAAMGILLLETVNYIEHYGLQRQPLGDGRYQRALPEHSWNSNHLIGRIMLFELSRHSDHHFLASRKYQVLRHHAGSPQLPTGYPGMMLLSTLPPLWFRVMNPRIRKFQREDAPGSAR